MSGLPFHSRLLRVTLSVLLAVWSGYGAVVRGDVFEHELAPRFDRGATRGVLVPPGGPAPSEGDTASETGLGEAALTYALFVVDASSHEVPVGTGGHGVHAPPAMAGRAGPGTTKSRHRPGAETGRARRHLLCVYRL
jgi:hypothetical protein